MRRVTALLFPMAGLTAFAACLVALAQDAPKEAPRKEEAKKAGVRVARPAVDENVIKQFEAEYGGQFRMLYKTELHAMRLITQPTKAQFDAIAAAGEPELKQVIRRFAVSSRGGPRSNLDPRAQLTAAIAEAAQKTLAPEQSARYRQELDARTAAHKRAAALGFVVNLDRVLILSAEQREKLQQVFIDNWTETWSQPYVFVYGDQYFPSIPDARILPLLTPAQKEVWGTIAKRNASFGLLLGLYGEGLIVDDAWDDDRPKPANGGAK
jgi:hypothetical protein